MTVKLSIFLVTLIILLTFITQAQAQTPTCLTHTVQTDDWLSKLADKHFGNPLAYPLIVQATNNQPAGYATITNPDLIEPGWRVCIPVNPVVEQAPQIQSPSPDGEVKFWQWALFTITQNEAGDTTGCLIRMTVDLVMVDTEFLTRCITKESGESIPVPELMGPQS